MASNNSYSSAWPKIPMQGGAFTFDNNFTTLVRMPVGVGTATAPGSSSPVVVADAGVTATSMIVLTPATPGGTQAGYNITSITAGTGFSVTFGSSDTTVYNWVRMG